VAGNPNYIGLPTDGTGKKLQTWDNTINSQDVHAEAVVIVDDTGTEKATSGNPLTVAGTVAVELQDGSGNAISSTSGALNVQVENSSIPVTGTFYQATQPVSGTVAVSNFPSTQPISGTVTANAGTGTLDVSVQNSSIAVTGAFYQATQPVSGTVTAEIEGHAGATLDSAAGTANSQALTIQGNTGGIAVPVSGSVSITGTPTVDIAASQTIAVTQATASSLNATVSGTVTAAQTTAANLLCKADIVGNAGATLDATVGAATAPTNGLAVLSQYNSSAPAPTAAQTMALQSDAYGNLFVNHIRRSQVVAKGGSINSTTAATVYTPGTGIYADLAGVVLTVGTATTAAIIQVEISDGTNTYEFSVGTGPTTATGLVQTVVPINFIPPIPATNTATAWTIKESAADATVWYVMTFILQKAS
jgi:hypothetical protein